MRVKVKDQIIVQFVTERWPIQVACQLALRSAPQHMLKQTNGFVSRLGRFPQLMCEVDNLNLPLLLNKLL